MNNFKRLKNSHIFKGISLILILTVFISCKTSRHPSLPNLVIEDKNFNKLIENRKPDYGIDGEDGCVVLGEISMNIVKLESGFIKGKVFDSESKDALMGAEINLILSDVKKNEILIFHSDQNGNFEKEFDEEIKKIEVKYIGFRDLKVNF